MDPDDNTSGSGAREPVVPPKPPVAKCDICGDEARYHFIKTGEQGEPIAEFRYCGDHAGEYLCRHSIAKE